METQSRCITLALCLVLAGTGFAARASGPQDEAAQVSGLTGKELAAFKANMDEVRVTDKQLPGSEKDVSAEQAKRMTTKELIAQTGRQKLIVLSMLHENPNIGLYRASRCSNSVAELLGRKDLTAAFLQAYSSFDPDPKAHPHFEDEGGVFALGWMLLLADYPPLQSRSAGHEKEVLSALCRKYREMQKANASYPEGQSPYGPGCFALDTAQRLARKVFPKARILSVRTQGDVELGVRELEQLCGS